MKKMGRVINREITVIDSIRREREREREEETDKET